MKVLVRDMGVGVAVCFILWVRRDGEWAWQ